MTESGRNAAPGMACAECGYALEGDAQKVCPECGWQQGKPVSVWQRARATGFYFACFLPVMEAVALVGWGVQHVLIPPGSRSTAVTAIGVSMLGVISAIVVSNMLGTRDRAFARLRWVSFGLAVAIGLGLGVLAVLRPGGHAVLLYSLTLFNAVLAYAALSLGGVSVGVLAEYGLGSGQNEPGERTS